MFTCKRYLARSSFTHSVQKRIHRRLWSFFRNKTDKNWSRTHFFFSFPTCKRSPSFWNRSASFFPEPVVLLRQPFTVNLMRFTPYIFAAIWRIKRRKLHHEKLKQKRLNLGKIMKSRCQCLLRSFKRERESTRSSLCSFISLALSVPVSKKPTCKRSLSVPRFSEDRAIFYPFPYKTCAYKRSNFVGTGTHFYPSRSAFFDV